MSLAPLTNSNLQRILILDANGSSRNLLSALLSGYFRRTELIFYAKTVEEAQNVIAVNAPSLIFIDMETIGSEGKKTDVVLTLEDENSVVQALELSNTLYLTKPYRIENLVKAMDLLSSNQQLKNATAPHQSHNPEKLTLRSQEGITYLDLEDIRRLESDSNYTHFFLKNGERITIPRTMKEYEDLLPSSHFFRTHQSHIVNLNLVKKFLKEDGGYALMDDGTQVLVSRRKKSDFLCALTA
jgi:two-component system LytT family response regulator